MDFLKTLLSSGDFMPHGYCYMWKPGLVWLHAISDCMIALAYFSIPITLIYFVRKRRDLPFNWMFVCFGAFILACGTTHVMEVWTLWHATYWLSGVVKAITALVSVPTAILLVRLVPQALALPSPEELRHEIAGRERAEERFRRYFELGLIGMAITSPTKGCIDVNDEICKMLGYSRIELLGMTWAELTHPDDVAADNANFERVMRGEIDGYAMDKRWIRRDGQVIYTTVSVKCLRLPDGSVDFFVALLQDITERKRTEVALAAAHTDLERRVADRTKELSTLNERLIDEMARRQRADDALHATRAELAHASRAMTLGEMTGSIAHELNQPLTAIVTNANACRRLLAQPDPDLDEVREAILDIGEAGTRAGEVIARIRGLIKKTPPERVRLYINEIIEEVLILMRRDLRRHNVSVSTELAKGLPPVLGDRVQLQQVLLNLILNGIEAMGSVNDRPRIMTIRSETSETSGVLVKVEDSGVGFDARNTEQIFKTFFTTKSKGMGMGLSISRSIIEGHGGHLWAALKDTPGAAFQFALAPAAG